MANPLPGLLPVQKKEEGGSYRLMHYVVRQPVEEGLLLYHLMTKSLVLLDRDEAGLLDEDPAKVEGLVENWFAVPESHDDRKLAQEVRAVGKMLHKPAGGIRNFTILTTTDCNARCFYCYEKGRSRFPMSDAVAEAAADYIIVNRGGESVKLRWFGGEPLYNKGAISLICSRLKEAGVVFRSSMVSNGLLFDGKTVSQSVEEWNLKKVQITLDGTEDTYNHIKNFAHSEGSPFLTVMGNIHRLLGAGVRVDIRLNIDRHNAEDIFALTEVLASEFGNNPLLGAYSHSLFESCDPRAAVLHSDLQRRELFEKQLKLQDKLMLSGLYRPGRLRHTLNLNHCMADSDSSVVILPDGHLGKCEHYSESEWFGHILDNVRDTDQISSFKAGRTEIEACSECPLYPDCIRLEKCEEAEHCHPEERELKLYDIRNQMSEYYSHGAKD